MALKIINHDQGQGKFWKMTMGFKYYRPFNLSLHTHIMEWLFGVFFLTAAIYIITATILNTYIHCGSASSCKLEETMLLYGFTSWVFIFK